jgi:hypothetical protein
MAFSGLASNELNTASLIQRSIADLARSLSNKETPLLAWIGDADDPATHIKHEFIEDFMLPNTIVTSTAISSAAVATPIALQVSPAGIGLALTVGQLLRNESAAPEVYQVTSIVSGGNSIVVSRDYNGTTVAGSLAAGGTLYVGGPAGVEGADHSGADTRRLGTTRSNTVGLFRYELAQSNTQFGLKQIGNDKWEDRQAKALAAIMRDLENEVIKGVLNGTNSLASSTTTRTMQGIQGQLTAINSTIAATSFATATHTYIGDLMKAMYDAGASPTEEWGIIAGSTFYRSISDLNDTKVQDSNEKEEFKRVIRTYTGPFGQAEVFLSRILPATELLIVSKDRLKVKNLQGRSFNYMEMATAGDNRKGLIVGEYTLELYHANAMARGKA